MTGQTRELVERPEVQAILMAPSTVPLDHRETAAALMAADLFGDVGSVEPVDATTMVIHSLFQSKAWRDARKFAGDRPDLIPELMVLALPQVLDALKNGLAGLDWSELSEEDRRSTEDLLEALLNPGGGDGKEIELDERQREALMLVLRMLVRSLDRGIAPLIDRLQKDAEVLLSLEEMLPGQGWDLHRVGLHRAKLGNLERYTSLLRKHKDVEHLKDLLGRMEGERDRKASSDSQSFTETHSLIFSGDVQRMLPQEMVNLADERLKLLFYARMCERRLLTYQLRGKEFRDGERKRGGPVVALLDSSGSMSGEPELAAKALLLALSRRLAEERRPLRALMFSVDVETYDLYSPGGQSQFLEFLCQTFGGGTDYDAALRQGIKSLSEPEWQGADILFITDGLARIKDRGCLHDWNCLKEKQGCRIFTVLVGGTEPGGLQRISDQVFLMSRHGEWSGGSLLQEFSPQPRSLGSCWVTQ
jgi:uncharacterized protein with von Willebrand factor type A (vWA) domain